MLVSDFHYDLPADLIAQSPAEQRDASRLLVVDRATKAWDHQKFSALPDLLRPDDILVVNDSRVVPARLRARKTDSGGLIEILLVESLTLLEWWVMLRPGKRVRPGTNLEILDPTGRPSHLSATVREKSPEGLCRLSFAGTEDLLTDLEDVGEVPLPPYIARDETGPSQRDRDRYQTVYARDRGSVAAPTAGLHFTHPLLEGLRQRGIRQCSITLHVGLGTFAPIKVDRVDEHHLHTERYDITPAAAHLINTGLRANQRVIAVGTTTVRVLEHVARHHEGHLVPGAGTTDIFLYPPAPFRIVRGLITNFHLPQSSLLMLVSAFASPNKIGGRNLILNAYAEAIRQRYRFFSYGDAMFIH